MVSVIVTASFFSSSTSASKFSTRKFIINSLVDGSKYFVVSLNGLHCEKPFLEESVACRHSNTAPYWLVIKPRCVLYHSLIAFGSLHLKKTPPIPVTLFIFA